MAFHQTYIAGVKFRDGAADRLMAIDHGTALDLRPEPENPHDPNAVQIFHEGFHLGYVPRDLAKEVGELIADKRLAKCVRRRGAQIEIHYTETDHAGPDKADG